VPDRRGIRRRQPTPSPLPLAALHYLATGDTLDQEDGQRLYGPGFDWTDPYWPYLYHLEIAATLDRYRATEREDTAIAVLIKEDPTSGYTRLLEALARRHNITIDWRIAMPDGAAGFANWRSPRITFKPIDRRSPEEHAAVGLHEIGHILAGSCPNRGSHHRDPAERLVALHRV
jgi:hypothetical protein